MKVRLRTTMAGPEGTHQPGEIVDFDEARAKDLIARRYAEPVPDQADAAWYTPSPKAGWTLQEALERTADPDAWETWIKSKAAFEKVKSPPSSSPGAFALSSPPEVREHRQRASEAWNKVEKQFRELLTSGTLVATGSRGDRSLTPTTIHSEGWRTLRFVNVETSIVREPVPTKTKLYNVRVFPLIHSEDAAARLSGCSIVQAFRKCVLQDPEVTTSSKRLRDYTRHRSVFEEGQFPGPMIDYRWPLDLTAEGLAYDFVRIGIMFIGDPLPKASPEIEHTATIMVDRWQRLRQRLIDGELMARGTYAQSGELRPIDQYQWARQGLSIEVQSGDLIEFENRKAIVRWSGISLVRPGPTPIAHPPPDSWAIGHPTVPITDQVLSGAVRTEAVESAKRVRRPSPKADAVALALRMHDLDQDRDGKSWKEIASIIAPDIRPPVRTDADMLALIKAVERHFRRRLAGRSG